MWALLSSVFLASLAGSLHCAGMCGPFVGFYAPGLDRSNRGLGHVGYNLGRLTSYVGLGLVAGFAGRGIDLAGERAGLTHVAALIASAVMVAWGLRALLGRRGLRFGARRSSASSTPIVGRALRRVQTQPPALRAALIGLSTTLLPCGWLYAFVVSAAGTGSPGAGALVMLAFWAGTLPMFAGLGVVLQLGGERLRSAVPTLGAMALVLVGLVGIFHRVTAFEADRGVAASGVCHGHD